MCLELGDPLGSMTGAARGGSWNERTVTDNLYVCWEQVDATKSSWLEPSCTPPKMLSASMRNPWQRESLCGSLPGAGAKGHERSGGECHAKVRGQGTVGVSAGSLDRSPVCFMKA